MGTVDKACSSLGLTVKRAGLEVAAGRLPHGAQSWLALSAPIRREAPPVRMIAPRIGVGRQLERARAQVNGAPTKSG
uniref:Uncharacterized protein n=1 Tax=Phenylobacterium glaciei TaxID=2803784 RepID=A0A974P4G1_9CAUL|nr:hypothetical protein JKL49_07605 [Phenylobacterium glaciei]